MRLSPLLICCPLIAASFPFAADLLFTPQEVEPNPLVPALIVLGGPFALACLAVTFAPTLASPAKALLVFLCGAAFGVGYLISMKYVRHGGPRNLAPIELVLITLAATICLSFGALIGSWVSMALKR
jgi:hypothetical protein